MARILIADDSELMRKALRDILTKSGHTVAAEAADGYEACLQYENVQPDLVTLDIHMPGMSGIDVLKALLSKYPHARIIVVSSESCSSMICQALRTGAKNYVIKPFLLQGLIDTVNSTLQQESFSGRSWAETI